MDEAIGDEDVLSMLVQSWRSGYDGLVGEGTHGFNHTGLGVVPRIERHIRRCILVIRGIGRHGVHSLSARDIDILRIRQEGLDELSIARDL